MVEKIFGNRNFMHPMGRFSMYSKCLDFFLKVFWGGGGGKGFFTFLLCSLQVPNEFPSGSQYVPKGGSQ
jgi:hypothetical protein